MHIKLVHLAALAAFGTVVTAHGAQLRFTGTAVVPIAVKPEASTGLAEVYVLRNTSGAVVEYESETGGTVSWQRFGSAGGGYAVPVEGVRRNGNVYSIDAQPDDTGYIVDDGSRRYCFWVTNYANHQLDLRSVIVAAESDCANTALYAEGSGAPITYYTVNGRPVRLSREIEVSYNTLTHAEGADTWTETPRTEVMESLTSLMFVEAPLCNTAFRVTGDRFLRQWGSPQSVSTSGYETPAVSAVTTAVQTNQKADNESSQPTGDLGGSAPCQVEFKAVPTDAVVFREWQLSSTPDFVDVQDRYQTDAFTYTFTEHGTFYVRYTCGDASGRCMFEGPVYQVGIGESKLECPNAFSPYNQDGVNDVWKVSYSSIISFDCSIFNRWGQRITQFSNPSDGWDGRHNGKFVPSGVYFYVIKARGADGKEYNLSGDINLLRSEQRTDVPSNP